MFEKKALKNRREATPYNNDVSMRMILENAIKMQALYSGGKVKIIESSKRSN